jgi:hypothetical protein
MARLCGERLKRYATAVQLYGRAFKAEPKLDRYEGARAAVLAGAGQGDEAGKLAEPAKIKLRQQARAWLQADLDRQAAQLKEANAKLDRKLIQQIAQRLASWPKDPDLAAVRDVKELAKLLNDESARWQTFWVAVAEVLEDAHLRLQEKGGS